MISSKYDVLFLASSVFWISTAFGGTLSNSSCSLPPRTEHIKYTTDAPDDRTDGLPTLKVIYACDRGYQLVGEGAIQCRAGTWTHAFPQCVPICTVNEVNMVQWGSQQCALPDNLNLGSVEFKQRFMVNEDCGRVTRNEIAGGAPVEISEVPWHAAVYSKTSRPYKQICGGTLVSTSVVISAAHCFWSDSSHSPHPASEYAVAVGKRFRPWQDKNDINAQKSDVKEIIVPPRYRGSVTNFQDDLSLLKLTTAVRFSPHVQPICLDFDPELEERQLQLGNFGKVAGWGLTSEDGHASRVLKAVEFLYVPVQQCIEESPPTFLSYITSDKICAGYSNGTALCRGDSGGGLVFGTDVGDRYVLRGVVSAAPSNEHLCNVYASSAFTLLSSHERFIRQHLSDPKAL